MLEFLLLGTFITSVWVTYILYYKPIREIRLLKQKCEGLGYKVEVLPYSLIGSSKRVRHKQDEKRFNDSYYSYKHNTILPDVTLYNIFNRPAIDIGNVQIVKQFYQPDNIHLYKKYETFITNLRRTLGEGILLSEGKKWKDKRKIMNNVFNYQFLISNVEKIKNICQRELNQYQKAHLSKQQPNNHNISFYLNDLAMVMFGKVILELFFGLQSSNVQVKGQPAPLFFRNLNMDILRQSQTPLGLLFGAQIFELGLSKRDKSINERIKITQTISQQLIQKRIQQIEKSGLKQQYSDIVEALYIKLKKQGSNLTSQHIKSIIDEFKTFYQAGTDTSSHFMQMMLIYIIQHPQIQKKLRQQVDRIIKSDDDITADNLKKLKYIDYIQNQTTRMYGPATGIMVRQADKDHFLSGIPIKKGVCITLMLVGIHYSQQFYKEPHKFRPQRWQEQCKNNPPFALGGFGGGPRTCIGKHFALLETKIVLIKILRRYKQLKLCEQQLKMRICFMYEPEKPLIRAIK